MGHLSSIADNVVVVLVAVEAVGTLVIVLPLSSRRREETLFTLSSTSYTRWFVGVVDASHVTLDLSTPTWNTRLVDSFMLRASRRLLARSPRAIGTVRMQWILRCCGRHCRSCSRLGASLSFGLRDRLAALEEGAM